ncbi:MAG: hypothetical protein NZ551_06245 [Microscillaceae bacterium]|nr:hypothetical protein [Microscillaceae bacterium]MDW8460795.1 hypothetical protein [Cytophagales bacterium]
MKTPKNLFFSFILFVCLLSTTRLSESCAWINDPFTHYYFFDKALFLPADYKPFHFTFSRLADYEWDTEQARYADNLLEWHNYFKQQADTQSIKQVIFKTTLKQVQDLKKYVLNLSQNIDDLLKNNALVNYLRQSRDLTFLDYLYFAKKVEPLVVVENEWQENTRTAEDFKKMENLAQEAEKNYFATKNNNFIRLRYAYQAIRLMHYAQKYRETINLYDKLVVPLNEKSIIKYWAMAHKAGALRSLGKTAEAAYLFSLVFDLCPSRRVQAYYSFRITSESDWNKVMTMCQNNHQKSTLYFLRALHPLNHALAEMENIFQLDANSTHLEILLMREINKLEYHLNKAPLKDNYIFTGKPISETEANAVQTARKLETFVQKVVQTGKLKTPYLWQLAQVYLPYLQGNMQKAKQLAQDLQNNLTNSQAQTTLRILEKAIQLTELKTLDEATEDQLYQEIKQLQNPYILQLLKHVFEKHYTNQKQIAKAYLAVDGNLYDLRQNHHLNLPLIEALLQLAEKSNKTQFEKEVLLANIDSDVNRAKNTILELKATYLFNQNQLQEALTLFKQIPNEILPTLDSNPFEALIKDCYSCDDEQKTAFNKRNVIEQILNLQNQLKNANNKASIYYQLGNVYYNMTYFGKNWQLLAYYRSHSELPKQSEIMAENRLHKSCNTAMVFYQQAIEAAEKEKNKELAAKACFMAAKCEQNNYFSSPNCKQNLYERVADYANFGKYFNLMKRNYTKTQFHNEALRECYYYQQFVRK